MDIEVGFPVVAPLPDEGPICAGVLPAGRYTSLAYVGNGYIGNKTLNEWAATNGIQVEAMKFGQIDQSDFLIPSFALFYIYTIFAAAFRWPILSRQQFFHWEILSWLGVFCCLAGVVMLWLSLFSFGKSFRVGIDTTHPDELVTTGIFALTRTPIYVAFGLVLIGQFLIFSNWVLLVYLIAAFWLFHRQVLREEDFMKQHYGQPYTAYCQRVRRYL